MIWYALVFTCFGVCSLASALIGDGPASPVLDIFCAYCCQVSGSDTSESKCLHSACCTVHIRHDVAERTSSPLRHCRAAICILLGCLFTYDAHDVVVHMCHMFSSAFLGVFCPCPGEFARGPYFARPTFSCLPGGFRAVRE